MKRIWKQIIALCLVSGLVNQAMLFGKAHLSPCGVNECSMDMEQAMTAENTSVRHETDTVNNPSLFSRLIRFIRWLNGPSFEPEEIEAIRERIQNEPRNIRHLIKKFREMLKVDFSKKLVRYTLIAALATAFIDLSTKLIIVLTCPMISSESESIAYRYYLDFSLKYTINYEHGDLPESFIILVITFCLSWVILSIFSRVKKIHTKHIITAVLGGLFIGGALSNKNEAFLRGGVVDWIPVFAIGISNIADFGIYLGYYELTKPHIRIIARYVQRLRMSHGIFWDVLFKKNTKYSMFINTKFSEYLWQLLIFLLILSGITAADFRLFFFVPLYEVIKMRILKMQVRTKMSSTHVLDVNAVKPVALPNSAGVSYLATSN